MRTEDPPAVLAERYALQALLERTSVGMVWLATDTVLDRTVTVTLFDPTVAEDPARRALLFDNARALATAAPSRLVRLLDAGTDHDVPFVVTERVPGETLAEVLERDGPLPAARAAEIVAAVLDAVRETDAVGIARFDLAPWAIVLDERGRVRIRDAAIAGALAGARGGRSVDELTAAGALLFELVTGRPADERRAARGVQAPRPIRTILDRSLFARNGQRYRDASSMTTALRDAARTDDRPEAGGGRTAFRTWIAVPLSVALVAALIAGAAAWLGRLEIGGIRLPPRAPAEPVPATAALPVASVSVLDPFGDGAENDDSAPGVADGDPTTIWRTEDYWDGTLNKPGVGLVLDLGGERSVTGFRVETPSPGFRFSILVGDDRQALIGEAADADDYTAPAVDRGLESRPGRYVVVWITSVVALPDGSHRAEISDVRILGSD